MAHSILDRVADGIGKWIDSWKDPEAINKNMLASGVSIVAGTGYPEHPGWRKEIRQNIEDRRINREASNFLDQLSASQRDIKLPAPELSKDREIER